MSKILITLTVALALAFGMTACEKKTPSDTASDAGKAAGTSVKDAANATGNAVGDAVEATGNAVGDAAEATGEAVGDATSATVNAVGDAATATGDYLTESKDSSVKTAQETLNTIEKKWQDLQAKAAPTTDEAKADLQKAKDQMAQTLADAKAKLVEAKDASADVWQQNIKPALDTTLQKAQKLYDDTAAMFGSNEAE